MTTQDLMTIIGVNLAMFGLFTGLIFWMVNRVDNDIKSLSSRLDGHATRIDQLYKMFIDLLQAKK